MNKIIPMLGASAFALGVMIGSVEAKKVSYEINGQRYTYESRDPKQAAAARQRIEAANAAEAAKAKADAERASNPLVSIFGSQAQRDAAAAQARVEQLIAGQEQASAQRQAARNEPRRKSVEEKAEEPGEAKAEQPDAPAPDRTRTARAPEPVPAAEPPKAPDVSKLGIKSVSFDMESGIKTTFMADGSVHEEPFDSSILEKLVSAQGNAGSLTAYVNQLRKAAPEDATGSTTPKVATPLP